MTYSPNNIFARILRGEIPCQKVAENEHALAFNDIHPQAPTHILVIPKGAYLHLTDFIANAAPAEQHAFWQLVGVVAEPLSEDGLRLITNQGLNGGQEVPHFHIHLLGGRALGRMVEKA
jgi:histidine triad (HIT) family protein